MASDDSIGNHGAFWTHRKSGHAPVNVIVSAGYKSVDANWEPVSVRLPTRCLTWDEMCFIKTVLWDPEDLVIQFHSPESDYVNDHLFVLHLWRKEMPVMQSLAKASRSLVPERPKLDT